MGLSDGQKKPRFMGKFDKSSLCCEGLEDFES